MGSGTGRSSSAKTSCRRLSSLTPVSRVYETLKEKLDLYAEPRLLNMQRQRIREAWVKFPSFYPNGTPADPCIEKYTPQLTVEDIEEILGIEKFDEEIAEKTR